MNKWEEFVKEAESLGCKVSFKETEDSWVYKLHCPHGEVFGKGVPKNYWTEEKMRPYLTESGLETLKLLKTGTIWGKPISL